MTDKLTPQQKQDIAERLVDAINEAAALGLKLGIHPQSVKLWLEGGRVAGYIYNEQRGK
jgi:hypothetical protein